MGDLRPSFLSVDIHADDEGVDRRYDGTLGGVFAIERLDLDGSDGPLNRIDISDVVHHRAILPF